MVEFKDGGRGAEGRSAAGEKDRTQNFPDPRGRVTKWLNAKGRGGVSVFIHAAEEEKSKSAFKTVRGKSGGATILAALTQQAEPMSE